MKLIVGLGNPGNKYHHTRHNIGRETVEEFATFFKAQNFKMEKKFKGKITEVMIGQEKVFCLLPETFMNHSGESVQLVAHFYKIPAKNILIVQDEMDFEPFQFAFTKGGGAGGHNGVKSVYQHIGEDIARFRIGIGRSQQNLPSETYVLQKFGTFEKLKRSFLRGKMVDAISDWASEGLTKAMNMWNGVKA